MKHIKLLLLTFLLPVLAFSQSVYKLPYDTVVIPKRLHLGGVQKPNTPGGTIFVVGASIEVGTGTTGPGYIVQLGKYMGMTVSNIAVSGSTIEKRSPVNYNGGSATNLIDQIGSIPTYSSTYKYMIIGCASINDWLAGSGTNYNPTNTATDLTTFVDAAKSAGWPASKILILSTSYPNPASYGGSGSVGGTRTLANQILFDAAIKGVATAESTLYFDIRSYIGNRGGIFDLNDNVHPNSIGHALMAQALYSFLVPSFTDLNQMLVSNGVSSIADPHFNPHVVIRDSVSSILGIDTGGKIGILGALPSGIRFLKDGFIGGKFSEVGASLPQTTMGDNDFLFKQGATIWGTYDNGAGFDNSIQLIDGGAQMNFKTTYSGGDINFLTHSIQALKITRGQQLWTNSAGDNGFGVAGDVWVPNGTGLGSGIGGQYGKFIPSQSSTNYTEILNTGGSSGISFHISGGSTGGDIDAWHIRPDGNIEGQLAGKGIIMKSPDGTRYILTIANGGTVAVTAAP